MVPQPFATQKKAWPKHKAECKALSVLKVSHNQGDADLGFMQTKQPICAPPGGVLMALSSSITGCACAATTVWPQGIAASWGPHRAYTAHYCHQSCDPLPGKNPSRLRLRIASEPMEEAIVIMSCRPSSVCQKPVWRIRTWSRHWRCWVLKIGILGHRNVYYYQFISTNHTHHAPPARHVQMTETP